MFPKISKKRCNYFLNSFFHNRLGIRYFDLNSQGSSCRCVCHLPLAVDKNVFFHSHKTTTLHKRQNICLYGLCRSAVSRYPRIVHFVCLKMMLHKISELKLCRLCGKDKPQGTDLYKDKLKCSVLISIINKYITKEAS